LIIDPLPVIKIKIITIASSEKQVNLILFPELFLFPSHLHYFPNSCKKNTPEENSGGNLYLKA